MEREKKKHESPCFSFTARDTSAVTAAVSLGPAGGRQGSWGGGRGRGGSRGQGFLGIASQRGAGAGVGPGLCLRRAAVLVLSAPGTSAPSPRGHVGLPHGEEIQGITPGEELERDPAPPVEEEEEEKRGEWGQGPGQLCVRAVRALV
ncbi:unnamed protein product [Arctogadus glacialis]